MDAKRKAQAIKGLQKRDDKMVALKAAGCTASDLIALGYTASALKALGYTASALKALGYTASDLIALGYTASALIAAGYTASALIAAGYTASALIAAGYTASALKALGYTASALKEWESIKIVDKPYTHLWNDIKAKRRKHIQSDWGPSEPPAEANVCGTAMCTAGHLVHLADAYDVLHANNDNFRLTATLVHMKSTSANLPMQNFGAIPQEDALATIEWLAALEDENSEEHKEYFKDKKK